MVSHAKGSVAVISDSMGGVPFWKGLTENIESRIIVINFVKKIFPRYKESELGDLYIDFSSLVDDYGIEKNKLTEEEKITFLEEMNVNLQEVIYADRHLGRGYFYFGSRHPRSKLADLSNYRSSLNYIYELASRIKTTLVSEKVEMIVLTGVASAQTKLICVIARSLGIGIRVLSPARIGNMYYWSTSEFLNLPIKNQDPSLKNKESGEFDSYIGNYVSVKRNIESVLSKHTLLGTLKDTLAIIKRELKQSVRNIIRCDKKSISEYYSLDQISYPSKRYFHKIKYNRLSRGVIKDKNIKYFYMPLHLEPESALMVLSPEINNQLYVIQSVSLALPNKVVLVVKENPLAVGKRPEGFYETIAKMPNVLLTGLEEEGYLLAKKAIATVVITGSTAIESVFFEKPVISFGLHNIYNHLPGVLVVESYSELVKAVNECLAYNSKTCYIDKEAVNDFIAEIVSCSVDLGVLKLSSYEAGKKLSFIIDL